jgi:chemotaxis protein MotB
MKKRSIFLIATISLILSSCVTKEKYLELEGMYNECLDESKALRSENENLLLANTEMASEIESLRDRLYQLEKDTTRMGSEIRRMGKMYAELDENYTALLDNNRTQVAKIAEQNRQLIVQMDSLQASLNAKEDSLRLREEQLVAINADLEARERRVQELESIIAAQDSAVSALKDRLTDALLGYEDKGLSIVMKDGKLYVTMENSLLFASGKYEVNTNGKQALKDLANVLKENSDISILIEGHTDDDAYWGGQEIRDNWDLSVMRATSVVKVLQSEGVEVTQLTAAGRGEHMPVASNETDTGKAQNRRIEIIIEPDLSEIMNLIRE